MSVSPEMDNLDGGDCFRSAAAAGGLTEDATPTEWDLFRVPVHVSTPYRLIPGSPPAALADVHIVVPPPPSYFCSRDEDGRDPPADATCSGGVDSDCDRPYLCSVPPPPPPLPLMSLAAGVSPSGGLQYRLAPGRPKVELLTDAAARWG